MNFISDEQITVDDTSGGVSLTVPGRAARCYIEIWTNPIYYTLDAAAPASGNGGRAGAGDVIDLMGDMGQHRVNMRSIMANVRMLRQSGSALAIVQYFD